MPGSSARPGNTGAIKKINQITSRSNQKNHQEIIEISSSDEDSKDS